MRILAVLADASIVVVRVQPFVDAIGFLEHVELERLGRNGQEDSREKGRFEHVEMQLC